MTVASLANNAAGIIIVQKKSDTYTYLDWFLNTSLPIYSLPICLFAWYSIADNGWPVDNQYTTRKHFIWDKKGLIWVQENFSRNYNLLQRSGFGVSGWNTISILSLLCILHICHFFYTTTIWGLKILHLKVRKFATKVASRQNSVNLHPEAQIHISNYVWNIYTVCKIIHFV